jgi:hypothetical protein
MFSTVCSSPQVSPPSCMATTKKLSLRTIMHVTFIPINPPYRRGGESHESSETFLSFFQLDDDRDCTVCLSNQVQCSLITALSGEGAGKKKAKQSKADRRMTTKHHTPNPKCSTPTCTTYSLHCPSIVPQAQASLSFL